MLEPTDILGITKQPAQLESMFVSELSLGPRGWVQISNFVLAGLLFVIFARGVAREFRRGAASGAGPLLLTLLGCCFFASGPLVMDPVSTPREAWSAHGTLHQLLGALAFSLMPVSCFLCWRRFRADLSWQPLRSWTLAAGVATVVSIDRPYEDRLRRPGSAARSPPPLGGSAAAEHAFVLPSLGLRLRPPACATRTVMPGGSECPHQMPRS